MAIDIITPCVKPEKFNDLFKSLIGNEAFEPAKNLIYELSQNIEDIDGNFAEQFQTTGFNQRLWELFLSAYFAENHFKIRREGDNPDFFICKEGIEIAVEAVTSNPTDNDKEIEGLISKALDFSDLDSQRAAQRKIIDHTTIKLGSALYSKLQKKYWEKEHIKGKPLILAIEAFHHSHANNFPDYKMISYLYGFEVKPIQDENGATTYKHEKVTEYQYGDKKIPFGFFYQPDAENISAVIFTNTGNLDKFNRIAHQGKYKKKDLVIARVGHYHNRNHPSAALPFEYYVGDGTHFETWTEGVSICHNPNATLPIDKKIFSDNRQIWMGDKGIDGYMPEFFPFASI